MRVCDEFEPEPFWSRDTCSPSIFRRPEGIAVNQVTGKIDFPPVVYVPCAPRDPGDEELTVDLRRTREGKLALLVYSALDRLVTCCGAQQPWVVLPTANLEEIREKTDFELILLDIEIPEEFRRDGDENGLIPPASTPTQ